MSSSGLIFGLAPDLKQVRIYAVPSQTSPELRHNSNKSTPLNKKLSYRAASWRLSRADVCCYVLRPAAADGQVRSLVQ